MKKPEIQIGRGSLGLDAIRIDGGTQMRAALNDEVVAEYAHIIREGGDFEPVVVFFDGSNCWLGDGFHRLHAYRTARAQEIPADVRQGTKRDAILYSVGANTQHGLRRSNADKRKAVETLLADSEWATWSDREIARRAGVSDRFVNGLRQEQASANGSQIAETRTVERNGSEYQQKTANIGKSQPATRPSPLDAAPEEPAEILAEVPSDKRERAAADRAALQAEFDRQREEVRVKLPESIRHTEEAKAAARAKGRAAGADEEASYGGLTSADRIAELEEHIRVLEAENAELRAENKLFGEMKVQWEKGGFADVIAGRDEEIRVLTSRVASESEEKVRYLGSLRRARRKLKELGHTAEIAFDIETGEVING